MKDALAVSSDVYFYEVGGGFGDQKAWVLATLTNISICLVLTEKTGIDLPGESSGTIATPEWKKRISMDDWRLGDTHHGHRPIRHSLLP